MPSARVWGRLLGVHPAVVETVEFGEAEQVLVARARLRRRDLHRCGVCRRRCPRYDGGRGRRRWRALDLGTVRAFVEAEAPRVRCGEHGVVVAAMPWARHDAGHTRAFDDTVAWLATLSSRTSARQLMRIAWPTVGSIITRVRADIDARVDRLAGLRRIGIDEISYKKNHRYRTVVVDHDTGRLVWAAPGNDKSTLAGFFELLGLDRCARITHVSADAAAWIARTVQQYCPAAIRCADPFHVVMWATDALDRVRRQAWNTARRQPGGSQKDRRGRTASAGAAQAMKRARWALWKNPENLTEYQRHKLVWIAKADPRLYRGYLLTVTPQPRRPTSRHCSNAGRSIHRGRRPWWRRRLTVLVLWSPPAGATALPAQGVHTRGTGSPPILFEETGPHERPLALALTSIER